MTPSEDRRYWLTLLIATPIVAVLSVVAAVDDWPVGWIFLSFAVLLAAATLFTHYPRERERAERETLTRARSARDRLPRR